MECFEVQQLLAFMNRKADALDETEHAAVQEHLDRCPDCSTRLEAERRADETIGAVMRGVTAPADGKANVLQRLAANQGIGRWKTLRRGALVTAASIVLLVSSVAAWQFWTNAREVDYADLEHLTSLTWDKDKAAEFFSENNLAVQLPSSFDFAHLQRVEIIQFKGRPVAKLTFTKRDECSATVLVLPTHQFRTNAITPDPTSLLIIRNESPDFTYLVLFHGNIDALKVLVSS